MLISVGAILDRSWQHYTKHFLELVSISAWLLLLAVLNIVSVWLSPDTLVATSGSPMSAASTVGLILYALTFFVLAPILSIWISNRLIKGIDQQLSGRTINLKELSTFGWKYFFPRLLVGFLTGVLVLAPMLLLVPGGAFAALSAATGSAALSILSTALIFIGVIAAGLGCVYIAVRVLFSPYTLLLENKRGRDAVKASAKLSAGKWWATFWRVVIPAVVFYFFMFTIQFFLLLLLKNIILSVAGLNVTLAAQLYNIGSGTVFIVLNALVAPLLVIANMLVYRSLRD